MKNLLFYAALIILLCTNLNGQVFTKVTEGDIVNDIGGSRACSWGDFNNDGYLDIFVANGNNENNFLYQNNGDGTFSRTFNSDIVFDGKPAQNGTWGDYDNDGYLDLFISYLDPDNQLFHNTGDGTFQQIPTGSMIVVSDGGGSRSSAWGDFDNDGFLDLVVANRLGQNNFLYRNNGDGSFTKITTGPVVSDGGNSFAPSWGDYDNDNYLDLFITNFEEDNFLYHNNGDGTFSKITGDPVVQDGQKSVCGNWVDFDNDGDLDLYVTNSQNENNALYKNNGDGTFLQIFDSVIVQDSSWSHTANWGDYNNDGYIDVFVSEVTGSNNFLFKNNGDGNFTRITDEIVTNEQGSSVGSAWADYDNDGDIDLFVTNLDNKNFLYSNDGNDNNWINIKLIGFISNKSAIGAKVRIKALIDGTPIWQMREISGQSGNRGQNSLNAEFGLGNATIIDSLKIEWPSSLIQIFTNIGVNQLLTITESMEIPEPIKLQIATVNAIPGDTVEVPVNVQFPFNVKISSFEMRIKRDNQKLQFIEILTDSSLIGSANWSIESNENDSLLAIAAAGSNDIQGNGELFRLKLVVSDTASGFLPVTIKSVIFDTGKAAVEKTSGGIKIVSELPGDVDLNDIVQAFDASLILKYLVGLVDLDHVQLKNANVSSDTTVSALDATLILQRVVGIVDSLPVDTSSDSLLAGGTIEMMDQQIQPGDTISIPLFLQDSKNILSFKGTVEFNSDDITFQDLIWPKGLDNFSFEQNNTLNEIRFAGAGTKPVNAVNKLVILKFVVNGNFEKEETVVSVTKFRFNESSKLQGGQTATLFRNALLVEDRRGADPERFELMQNYPNPFNPETMIQYQLAQKGDVEIVIYNLLGEKIISLFHGLQGAGFHQLIWDGKNELGTHVSSGVYIYHIKTEKFVSSKKMLLLR